MERKNKVVQKALRPALKQLKNRYELVGAEIGVKHGVNALYYLEELDIKQILLIDPYMAFGYTGMTYTSKEAREWEEEAHINLDKYKHKIKWIKEKSADAVKFIADNSLDFVYIDGNHDYEFVVEDILLYYPKVKEGGLLSGHDYHWESVRRAVDDFVKTNSLDLCIGETKEIRRKKTYDWWIWKKRNVNKLFIDVGVGKPSSEAWDRKWKNFTIIGLEPCTNIYNNLKDIYPGKLLNIIAADRNEDVDCWESSNMMILFMREDNIRSNYKKVRKKAIKLDSLDWRVFDEIHIWADIEGAELLMLKGATEMLSSGKVKWINLEVRKNAPAEGWCTAKQVYEFLNKYGFNPIMKFDRLHAKGHRDVIFLPKEV